MERINKIRQERRQLLQKLRDDQAEEQKSLTEDEQKINNFQNLLAQTEIFSVNMSSGITTTVSKK